MTKPTHAIGESNDQIVRFLGFLTGRDDCGGRADPSHTEAQRHMKLVGQILERACTMAVERTYELAADGDGEALLRERQAFAEAARGLAALLRGTQLRFRTVPIKKEVPHD